MGWTVTPQQKIKGLLDEFTGAAAAYSLRNLSVLRNAPVVRVRRSSDNTEQDFAATQVTDGSLTTFCGAGDGFVSIWYDQTNNQRNFSQQALSAQPRVVIAGTLQTSSGLPSIDFNGSTHSMIASVGGFSSFNYFRVAHTSDTDYIGIAASSYVNYGWVATAGSSNTTLNSGFGTPIMYSNGVLQSLSTRGQVYTALNGRKLETTLNASTLNSPWSAGINIPNNFSGKLCELVIYGSSVSTTRASIESNINAYYAIY